MLALQVKGSPLHCSYVGGCPNMAICAPDLLFIAKHYQDFPIVRFLRPEEKVLQPLKSRLMLTEFTLRSLHSAQWLVAGLKHLSCYSQRGSSFRSWARFRLFSDFSQGEKNSVPSEPNVTFFLFSCHMKNWKIVLTWNIPFSSKVVQVTARKAKEEIGAMFKGDAVSVPPQLSRAHTGLDCGRNSTESFCWTDFNHLSGECHKHMTVTTMCGICWLVFISFHAVKYPLLPISKHWNASVFLPYSLTSSRALNCFCYLSEKYFIQKTNRMEDSRHTLFRTTFFWWWEDLLRKWEI